MLCLIFQDHPFVEKYRHAHVDVASYIVRILDEMPAEVIYSDSNSL